MSEPIIKASESQVNLSATGTQPVAGLASVGINREFQEKSAMKAAKDLGLPYVDLAHTPLNPDFLNILPYEESAKARTIVFFRSGQKLQLATADTRNADLLLIMDKLKLEGFEAGISLASAAGINDALNFYDQSKKYKKLEVVNEVDSSKIDSYVKEIEGLRGFGEQMRTMTSQETLNLLNVAAMKTGATDMHFEPQRDFVVLRFRIDGVLYEVLRFDKSIYANFTNQLKYEAKIQINVDSVPQDGRYSFDYNGEKVAVRVSSLPTNMGESFVCRILKTPSKVISFEDLGFFGTSLHKLEAATGLKNGMILCTGPTGSGKTTTLYSMLGRFSKPENKVITLEDPVEYGIPGVTQSQINEKRGYDFASGLRTILRQDPDVVMIGEIRDLETAKAAVQAALTGHVLLSTLHTNSAIETIPRLLNMGLEPFMIAPSLDTVIAQRLVRRVCSNCVKSRPLSLEESENFKKVLARVKDVTGEETALPKEIPLIAGCEKCSRTGYVGRLVISEVFHVNEEMRRLILAKESSVKLIEAVRKQGFITMMEDGYVKVARGQTTLDEVARLA